MIIALTEAQSCQLAMSLMASFSVGITFGGSIVMEIACPYLAKAESALSNHERRSPKLIPRSKSRFIWSFIGDQEPPELELPFELADPSYSMFPESVEWSANWLLAYENLADIMHAPFLHNRSLTLSGGIVEDSVNVSNTETGFRVERVNQQGVNFDQVEIDLGHIMHCRLDIPLKASFAGPGPNLRIVGFVTPVDDQNSVVHFPRFRQVSGWRRALGDFYSSQIAWHSPTCTQSRQSDALSLSDRFPKLTATNI